MRKGEERGKAGKKEPRGFLVFLPAGLCGARAPHRPVRDQKMPSTWCTKSAAQAAPMKGAVPGTRRP